MSSLLPEGAGIVVGVGVGAAASAAIEPAVEIPKQEAWERNQNRLLAAGLMAALVAQGALELPTGHSSANREGYTSEKFDHLVYLAQTAPGASEALEQWRKGFISTDLYEHSRVKNALDSRYIFTSEAYRLKELVGLGDIAYGIVRGILPAPSWLPVAPPASGDLVPRFPQVELDPLELAHKLGFNEDMLRLMVGRSGLSMAPVMAANARFRDIIGPNDYLLAIAEGDLRTEWADAVLDTSRQILTAGEYAELQLRGFYGETERRANTAKHGMTQADSDLLYNVLGRSVSVHQVTTGLARGGTYPSVYADVPQPYRAAIQRSNIREEWVGLAYANRYTYPSAFVLRSLAEAGDLGDAAAVQQILEEIGWKPELAASVSVKWVGGTTTVSAAIKSEQSRLRTAAHKSYVARESDDAAATAALQAAGVPIGDVPAILAIWQAERGLIRAQLSPADIRKAYRKGTTNAATGAKWTRDEALAALIDRGWGVVNANDYLDI